MTAPDLPQTDDDLAALLRAAAHDPAPPPQVLARALALRGPVREAARQAVAALRRLIAVPVLDAASGFGAAPGVRAAGASPRQLLFRAEACEVDVRISARGAAWSVAGQVFGAPDAREVVLAAADGAPRTAELGPTGEFGFTGVTPGRYQLTVRTAELEIVIPSVEVGPAARP
jgi:hypothetical protein